MPVLSRSSRIYSGATKATRAYLGSSLKWIDSVETSKPTGLAAHYNAERVFGETLLADDFNRANGALGSVPGPGDPVAWQNTASYSISDNQLTVVNSSVTYVESGAADVVVSADVECRASGSSVALRLVDTSNFLQAYVTPNGTYLYKVDTGGFVVLNSNTAVTHTAGVFYNIRFVAKGDQLRVFVDGQLRITHTMSAGEYTKYGAATKVGFRNAYDGGAVARYDNFTVRTLNPTTDLAAAVDTFDRSTAAEIIDLAGTRAGGTGTALRLPGLTSNHTSTPFASKYLVTGEVEVEWYGVVPTPNGDFRDVIAHGPGAASSANYEVRWHNTTPGQIQVIAADGSVFHGTPVHSFPLAAGTRAWFRARYNPYTGTASFSYDAVTPPSGTPTWTTTASSMPVHTPNPASNSTLTVGSIQGARPFNNLLFKVSLSIDGTVVASPDFTAQAAGTTSFTDDQGNVWTINQSHGSIGSTETGEAPALAWTVGAGTWRTNNGRLIEVSDSSNNSMHADSGVADVDVSARVVTNVVTSSAFGGVIFRFIDTANYLMATHRDGGTIHLYKRDGGVFTAIASASIANDLDEVSVRAVAVGDRVWVYADGVLVITHTLSGADQTKFGAATRTGVYSQRMHAPNYIDNFRVSRPPLVAVWPDLSGNHRHAVQTTTANQPVLLTNLKNGRSVVEFDGVDDFLLGTFTTGFLQLPNTILLAAMLRTSLSTVYTLDGTSGSRHRVQWQSAGLNAWNGSFIGSSGVNTLGAWEALTAIFKGSAAGATSKTRVPRQGAETLGTSGDQNLGGIAIGASYIGTQNHHGPIGEVIIIDGDAEALMELVPEEDYLIRRWT